VPCFFRFFFPVILSFFCANISAQQQFLLKGKIVSDDKEVMVSVNIFSQESQTGTYSDTDGNFQLQLPEGNHTILFSFIGYKTKTITVTLQRDTFISVVLKNQSC
jgi:TonB-dependent starch-binding outer membrane protein SusC